MEMTASRTGVSYSIFDPVKSFTLVESAVPVAEDSIDVDVGAYNRVLKLRTSPVAGWLKHTVCVHFPPGPRVWCSTLCRQLL